MRFLNCRCNEIAYELPRAPHTNPEPAIASYTPNHFSCLDCSIVSYGLHWADRRGHTRREFEYSGNWNARGKRDKF